MNEKSKIFDCIIDSIENEDMREFAQKCRETIPNYFWNVGASSTGKYHPKYALGDLGLARHTVALVRILNYVLGLDCFKEDFNSRERDMLRIAGMMHDSRKSGSDDDYAKNSYTKFDHPNLAASVVRSVPGLGAEKEIIATTIETHMGQWNTDKRSSVILATPKDKYQKILHMCDYLASRKDIEVLFDGQHIDPPKQSAEQPTLDSYVLPFGKYKGLKLTDVAKSDPSYISWIKHNIEKEPLKSLLKQLEV